MRAKVFGAMAFAAIAATSQAGTPNTTAAGAVSYEVGEGWVTHGIDEGNQNRWFAYTELPGRSYCVEAALGPATYVPLDPNLTLYSDSGGTAVYLSNTDGAGEPPQYKGSRICYLSPLAVGTTMVRLFKVNVPVTASSGDSGFVRTRVVDTTLVFPVYWIRNGSAGTATNTVDLYLANTGITDINATVFVPGYGTVATYTTNGTRLRAPNQSTGSGQLVKHTIQPPAGVVNFTWGGAVYIPNDGPPGSLEAWADSGNPVSSGTDRYFALPR